MSHDGTGLIGLGVTTHAPGTGVGINRPRRPWRFYVILAALMLALCGGIAGTAYNVYANYRANVAANNDAISQTQAAVTKAGWTPMGTYTVEKGMVQGKVAFGNNCSLDVSAPWYHPDQVTVSVTVVTGHNVFGDTKRTHSWPITAVSPQIMAMNAPHYGIGDCTEIVKYDG